MRAFWAFPLVIGMLSAPAGAVSPQPEAVIPLSLYAGVFPAMQATVNGRTGTYLFDTGGGVTGIGPAAASIGCAPWGNITGYRMTGERLDAPRCDNVPITTPAGRFTVPSALIFDINTLLGKDMPPIEGSIALDIFAGKALTLELSAQRLVLESSGSLKERTAAAREVPIRLVRDAQGIALTVDIGVPTEKGLAWMEVDSGNVSPTMFVSTWIAPLFKLDPALRDPQTMTGEVIAGARLPDTVRVVPNMIMDGNIGANFLKQWNLTVDLKAGRAWLSPARVGGAAK